MKHQAIKTLMRNKTQALMPVLMILICLNSIKNIQNSKAIPYIGIITLIFLLLCLFYTFINREGIRLTNRYFYLGNAFVFLCILSTIYSIDKKETFTRSIQLLIIFNTIYLLISKTDNYQYLIKSILIVLISFTTIASLYCLIIYYLGYTLINEGITISRFNFTDNIYISQIMAGSRPSSFIGNPNSFGAILMYSTLSSMFLSYLNRNSTLYKWLFCLLSVLFLYCLWLTNSRASFLGIFLSIFTILFIHIIKKNKLSKSIIFYSIGLAVASVLLLENAYLIDSLNSLFNRQGGLLNQRDEAWLLLIESIKNHPIFGIGYYISDQEILKPQGFKPFTSHNLYLAILAETGITGFFLFLIFIFYPIPKLLKIANKTKNERMFYSYFICSILCAYYFNQFFEETRDSFSIVFVLIISFLIFGSRLNSKSAQKNN